MAGYDRQKKIVSRVGGGEKESFSAQESVLSRAAGDASVRQADQIEEKQERTGAAFALKMRIVAAILPVLYGICNGLGDYFIALGTQPGALGSSVTFPIVNGGTILFSTLIGCLFYREKFTLKTMCSLLIIVASTVLFMFA